MYRVRAPTAVTAMVFGILILLLSCAVEAGTPSGTPSAVEAGTPSGTPSAVEAGTPSGTPSAVEAGTPSGTPSAATTVSVASPAPHARILSPANGSKIAMVVKARGTASHLKGRLWLVVYSPVVHYRYYPQTGPVTVSRTGKWSGAVYFGTVTTHRGEPYTLLAVQASPAASAAMTHYLDVGKRTGKWPGLVTMPRGSLQLAHVHVTRK